MARSRQKLLVYPSQGLYQRYLSGVLQVSGAGWQYDSLDEKCDDSVGRHLDHPLTIVKKYRFIEPLNGIQGNPPTGTGRSWTNVIPAYPANVALDHLPISGLPSEAASATTLLARTNPGRASVSLPVFIGELRDLPHMLKVVGDTLPKKAAHLNLSWQFGWKPLISDLRKMLDFQASVDKRARELARLYSKGGLKRRMRLGTWGAALTTTEFVDSAQYIQLTYDVKKFTAVERWGTVRWLPTDRPSVIDSLTLKRLARKAVFGLSIQGVDAWNLIPWTWLIDWFSNCGEYLEAHNNRIPCTHQGVNIMTSKSTTVHMTRRDSVISVKGGTSLQQIVTKSRALPAAGLTATLPNLSARQLSILGSIAILRKRRVSISD